MEYADYTNTTNQQIYINDSLRQLTYQTQLNVVKYGLSAQASHKFFSKRLAVTLGVRMDGNNYNASTSNLFNQFSPRASFSYSITDRLSLNAGLGRFFQQAAYTTMGYRDVAGSLVNEDAVKYIGLNQYNLGLEHKISDRILISIEGFYKDYFQYPIDLITGASLANQGAGFSSVAGASPVDFSGRGEAIGFEVLNRWNYKTFSLLASYTFVRSLFTSLDGKYLPSSWDSKHLLTLTGSKELKKNWRIGLKWRYVGGLPYTPYDYGTSANIQAWNANGQPYLDFNRLNALRFEPFHQLDLRLDKNFFFKKWSLMLYLDIQNAYNFKNKGKDYVIRERNADGSFKTTNNGTEYVLQSIENKSGTILPTIGIMIKF